MKKKSLGSEIWEYVKIILVSFIIVFLLKTFIICPVQVVGSSMYPTLKNEEMGFTNVISRKVNGIDRFDVVVAYLSEKNEKIVKRVIGMPFDTIACEDGVIYINNEAIDEYFLDQNYVNSEMAFMGANQFTDDFGPITLKEKEYFLMGDNRLHSSDSRVYGVFYEDEIISKDVYVWFPFNQMRIVNEQCQK